MSISPDYFAEYEIAKDELDQKTDRVEELEKSLDGLYDFTERQDLILRDISAVIDEYSTILQKLQSDWDKMSRELRKVL